VGNRHRDPAGMSGRLLVAVSEAISEWIAKGEVVDRYYNPGDRFDEVHLLLTNDDAPDSRAVQRLVGRATVHVHNLPTDRRLLVRTLGWRPSLLRRWAQGAVEVAQAIRPDLVRCHGAHLNGACALAIRRALGTPVVVSLHTLPDDPAYPPPPDAWARIQATAIRSIARQTLRDADLVLAVYESQVPYLERVGARRIEVVYNLLNGNALRVKDDYVLHDPVRTVSVGRQIAGKDPSNVVRAAAARPHIRLRLVGGGPLESDVRTLVDQLDARERIALAPALPNDELVASLADDDLFVARNDYLGVPKAVLEAMLAGLPIVVNGTSNGPVPELNDGVCLLVEPTAEGFGGGIDRMLEDDDLRERLGRTARAWAERTCLPERVERRVVELYNELLASSR
jgi:glycosyltransferase involved in cell wall biosynthesis